MECTPQLSQHFLGGSNSYWGLRHPSLSVCNGTSILPPALVSPFRLHLELHAQIVIPKIPRLQGSQGIFGILRARVTPALRGGWPAPDQAPAP